MHLCSAVNRFENYHTASRAGEIGEMIRQEDNVPLSTCKHCVSKAGAGFRNQFLAAHPSPRHPSAWPSPGLAWKSLGNAKHHIAQAGMLNSWLVSFEAAALACDSCVCVYLCECVRVWVARVCVCVSNSHDDWLKLNEDDELARG
mmetsp:Transcript_88023/g.284205  ORF Transcript_88023/g.284205 Transcript_88023/m.284205 type:complete len:145 (+) Transcript_88023:825-1259(+)